MNAKIFNFAPKPQRRHEFRTISYFGRGSSVHVFKISQVKPSDDFEYNAVKKLTRAKQTASKCATSRRACAVT